MSVTGVTYGLGVSFWLCTAIYGVLSLQAFIQEQFLQPRLFSPIAAFSDWHTGIGLLTFAVWCTARWEVFRRPLSARPWVTAITWCAGLALLALSAPLSPALTAGEALLVVGTGVFLILMLGLAECRSISARWDPSTADRSLADLTACIVAALAVTIAHVAAAAWVDPHSSSISDAADSFRLHLLLAGAGFLALSAVRAVSALTPRPIVAETRRAGQPRDGGGADEGRDRADRAK